MSVFRLDGNMHEFGTLRIYPNEHGQVEILPTFKIDLYQMTPKEAEELAGMLMESAARARKVEP